MSPCQGQSPLTVTPHPGCDSTSESSGDRASPPSGRLLLHALCCTIKAGDRWRLCLGLAAPVGTGALVPRSGHPQSPLAAHPVPVEGPGCGGEMGASPGTAPNSSGGAQGPGEGVQERLAWLRGGGEGCDGQQRSALGRDYLLLPRLAPAVGCAGCGAQRCHGQKGGAWGCCGSRWVSAGGNWGAGGICAAVLSACCQPAGGQVP